jgi:hypothetical protein
MEDITRMEKGPGCTVIVISYDRPHALESLLRGLSVQRLDHVAMELMVCNNAQDVQLSSLQDTSIGRLLHLFPDVKIMNSSHNWLCRVRYPMATLARHDTIIFIDDDVVIKDDQFVKYMYDAFTTVGPTDILSCWTALWTEWNDDHLKKVRMNWSHATPDVMIECDYAGPGLCIFDRRILIDSGVLRLPREFHRSDSTWFPWLTAMRLGTRKYYLPSYGRVEFHPEGQRHALMKVTGFREEMYAQYKAIWKQGYVPVLERKASEPDFENSLEAWAARTLPIETDPW